MRAILKPEAARGLSFQEVPEPEIRPDEVLIRVRKAGICGTDLHIYDWDEWSQSRVKPPLILGHEFMGHVTEVGELVDSVDVGAVSYTHLRAHET